VGRARARHIHAVILTGQAANELLGHGGEYTLVRVDTGDALRTPGVNIIKCSNCKFGCWNAKDGARSRRPRSFWPVTLLAVCARDQSSPQRHLGGSPFQ
jgi:hypothetical protein